MLMGRRSSLYIVLSYTVSLLFTTLLLVMWVIYVLRAQARINELAAGVGVSQENFHWWILAAGCLLFALVIAGLTHQLAQTLSARRYSAKQDEFVASITHELKSPLAAIRLHAQTLLQSDIDREEQERFLGYIEQQAVRMEGLVDNVLETSRLQARRERLRLEPLELRPFLEGHLEEVRERFQGQGLTFSPQIATDAWVLATEDALYRILDNLLENAASFSSHGGEIRLLAEDGPRRTVLLAVEDDGIGIPKSELRRVFDRFYQIGREISGRRRGTGLGLAIAQGLVREMNGKIQAVSPEGRPGVRFEIVLPQTAAPAPASSSLQSEAEGAR